jgi:hypothetical protein
MMAKMVQTAKQTVKAMVDIHSARLWPGTLVAAWVCMMPPAPVVRKVSGATYAATSANALTPINNTTVMPATIWLYYFCDRV